MSTSTAMTLCGLTLAMMLAGGGGSAQAEPSVRIDFETLDLTQPEDVESLYTRIKLAARMVCSDSSSPWDAKHMRYIEDCRNAVVADAVERIDQPLLTALHFRGDPRERLGLAAQ